MADDDGQIGRHPPLQGSGGARPQGGLETLSGIEFWTRKVTRKAASGRRKVAARVGYVGFRDHFRERLHLVTFTYIW